MVGSLNGSVVAIEVALQLGLRLVAMEVVVPDGVGALDRIMYVELCSSFVTDGGKFEPGGVATGREEVYYLQLPVRVDMLRYLLTFCHSGATWLVNPTPTLVGSMFSYPMGTETWANIP